MQTFVQNKLSAIGRRAFVVRGLLLAVTLLGIAFRFHNLAGKQFWEDEIYGTIHALGYTELEIVRAAPTMHTAADLQKFFHLPAPDANRSISSTIFGLAAEDPQHPPIYYILSHLWMELTGTTVGAIRALPAAFSVVMMAALFWLTWELFESITLALCSAALLAVSPIHVLYAQEAREYSLWSVAILLSCATLLRALRLHSGEAWTLYGVTNVISLYVFPFSGFILIGQAVFMFATRPTRSANEMRNYLLCAFIAFFAYVPWLFAMRGSRGFTRTVAHFSAQKLSPIDIGTTLGKNVMHAFVDLGRFHIGPISFVHVHIVLLIVIVILSASALYELSRPINRSAAYFVIFVLCAPILGIAIVDLFGTSILVMQARYFMPLYLGIEIAVAYMFYSKLRGTNLWKNRWSFGFVVLLAGGFASCVISDRSDTWWNKDYEQNRFVAARMNDFSHPMLIADQHSSVVLGASYYLHPDTEVRLNLSCDNCDGDVRVGRNLLTPIERTSTPFLLGKPIDSAFAGGGNMIPIDARIRWIDTTVFPRAGPFLNLFSPVK